MGLLTDSKELAEWIKGWGIEPLYIFTPIVLLIMLIVNQNDPRVGDAMIEAFVLLLPFWLVGILARVFWTTWMQYVRFQFWLKREHVLLRIEPPREVAKSPLAMELFLSSLWNYGGETTFLDRLWKGQFRAISSLEIASNEGRVNFYVHIQAVWQKQVEARLYGQFPESNITAVDDYATLTPFDTKTHRLHGVEFGFGRAEAYPIKTYIDYKLDKDPDEELKVDPITQILEFMGHIGKEEYMWMQLIVRARKKDEWFGFYRKKDMLKHEAQEEIHRIMAGAARRSQQIIKDNDFTEGKLSLLTDGEKRKIEAIERKMGKPIFECGIRVVYLAPQEKFNVTNNRLINRFFDAFRSHEFNEINPERGMVEFNYPWQDIAQIRHNAERRRLFFRYRNRAYFFAPYQQEHVSMNAEELATLWHFPGSVVQTPSLSRAMARSSAPPANLPT